MDPNATADQLRARVALMATLPSHSREWEHEAEEAWQLADELKQWMRRGGFQPPQQLTN